MPVTAPPGTAAHREPSQYRTSNDITPYFVNVIGGVGSDGEPKLEVGMTFSTLGA